MRPFGASASYCCSPGSNSVGAFAGETTPIDSSAEQTLSIQPPPSDAFTTCVAHRSCQPASRNISSDHSPLASTVVVHVRGPSTTLISAPGTADPGAPPTVTEPSGSIVFAAG